MNAKRLFLVLSLFATLVASADITGLTDLMDDLANRTAYSGNDNINGKTTNGEGAFNLIGATQSTVNNDESKFRLGLKVTSSTPLKVDYQFQTDTVVNAYRIWNQGKTGYSQAERAPSAFYLEGTSDGLTWTTLDSRSGQTGWDIGEPRVFEFRNKTAYPYYRMTFTAGNGDKDGWVMIQELEYFCRPVSDDSLTVTGSPEEYGSPTPGYGERSAEKDGTVEASIATPIELDTGKLAGCVGWKTEKLGDDEETWNALGSGVGNETSFVHPGGDVRLTWNFEVSNQVAAVVHGSGTATGGGWFLQDTDVTLKATADEGYEFVRWIGDTDGVEDPTATEITVTANSPRTLTAFFVPTGMPKIQYVSRSGNDANDGLTLENAKATVGAAVKYLDQIFAEGVVLIEAGTYEQSANIVLSNAVEVVGMTGKPQDVILRNTAEPSSAIKLCRVFTLQHPQAFVSSLTMADGKVYDSMGGNVAITGNGGVVSNCVIASGCGRLNGKGANAALNSANGIITHCVISNGVLSSVNSAASDICTAVHFTNEGGRLSNCLIVGNAPAENSQQPVLNNDASICVVAVNNGTMDNCTIVDNCHTGLVSAVWTRTDRNAKVVNCVIAGTTLPDGTAVKAASGSSTKFFNCVTDGETVLNSTCKVGTLEEMFENPTDGKWLPKAGGILDNAGTAENLAVPSVDLRGNPRIHGDAIDVGCYEIAAFGFIIRIR